MLAVSRAVLAGVPIGGDAPVAVVGVVNVSPESFYTGSVPVDDAALVDTAQAMVEAGAVLLDVGARSTAPYRTTEIDDDEESRRLARAIERLTAHVAVPISADTPRLRPARAALNAGARVLNDVSGLADARLAELVAERGAGAILMASPDAVAGAAAASPVDVVALAFARILERARRAGIADEHVVLDPGIGFFRDVPRGWVDWDVSILAGLRRLAALGRPLCVGVSRKSFLGAITGRPDPADRLAGSVAAATAAVLHGAAAIRTHDVRETADAVRVAERLRQVGP